MADVGLPSPQFQIQQQPPLAIDRLPDPEPSPNRRWHRKGRLALVCLCIAGNCLTAGGVTAFSLFAPYIQHHFRLDQAATNTVVVGGLLGAYFAAGGVGVFADRFGPRWTSLLAGALNLAGYLWFTLLLALPRDSTPLHLPVQYALSLSYILIGSGTVSSYFCALKCSTLNFPARPAVALGVPLAFFGLSGASLSFLAGAPAFSDGAGELDARRFAAFLTALVAGINVLGAAGLKVMPSRAAAELLREEDALADGAAREHRVVEDEETPLLARVEEGKDEGVGALLDLPVRKLLRESSFWVLGGVLFCILGPAEMFVSSLGSLILALLPASADPSVSQAFVHTLSSSPLHPLPTALPSSTSPLQIRQTQLLFFSFSSTLARLLGGLAADWLAAPANTVVPHPPPARARSLREWLRRPRASKLALLLVVLGPLGAAYAWAALGGLKGTEWLPVMTVVVGWSYGCIFTLAPAIVAQVFGLRTFGRNFGFQSYFMAASSLLFTYLYGLLAEAHRTAASPSSFLQVMDPNEPAPFPGAPIEPEEKVCRGTGCFRGVFALALGATVIGAVGVVWLRRRWRGRT